MQLKSVLPITINSFRNCCMLYKYNTIWRSCIILLQDSEKNAETSGTGQMAADYIRGVTMRN